MNRIRHFLSSRLNNRGFALLVLLSLFVLKTMLSPRAQQTPVLSKCKAPATSNHQVNCDGIGQKANNLFELFDLGIDLNQATVQELALVPKMRRDVAKAIIEKRDSLGRFSNYGQVSEVKGVGPKTLEQLRKFTTL